jgi:predicted HD superfamily hydrolase involved in NAD metabolism
MDFSEWTKGIELGHGLRNDVREFLTAHSRLGTLRHVELVAEEAMRLAKRFGADPAAAEQAGLIHDISAVIPYDRRLEVAKAWNMPYLPVEAEYPLLLHQGLSVVLARKIFGIKDEAILTAVGCHTTLRPGSTRLDQVLFLADKIAWDHGELPPYLTELTDALDRSLADACRFFLEYLSINASGPVHPWVSAALDEFNLSD